MKKTKKKAKKRIIKEKEFNFKITISFDQSTDATTLKEAREFVRESFYQDFGLDLTDKEIKQVK